MQYIAYLSFYSVFPCVHDLFLPIPEESADLEACECALLFADLVLIMSVNPGFGGQKFIAQSLEKLKTVRARIDANTRPVRLEIDGGVKVENIGLIAAAGADTFVAGSAVFGSPDYAATLKAMRTAIDAAR